MTKSAGADAKMRIAVWHNLPSGGGKRALDYHVRGLVEKGHSVEAWCPSTNNRTYLPLSNLIREHLVPINIPHRNKLMARTPENSTGSNCAKRTLSMNTARGVRKRSTAEASIFCLLILQSFTPSPQLGGTLRQRRCSICRSPAAGCTKREEVDCHGLQFLRRVDLGCIPATCAGLFSILYGRNNCAS